MWPLLIYGEHMWNWLKVGMMVGAVAPGVGGCSADTSATSGGFYSGPVDGDQTPGDGDSTPGDGDQTPGDGDSTPGDGDQTPGDGDGSDACGSIEKEAAISRGPVDIIIVLDTSLSMADEVCNVASNLTQFASGVGAEAHVVSVYQMGFLGAAAAVFCGKADPLAETPLAKDATRYLHRDAAVDSWNALQVLLNQYDSYKTFLRPEAPTHFIVVSDDESNVPANTFLTQMKTKLGRDFYLHSIVNDGSCGLTQVGNQYVSLSNTTGGQKLPICTADWSGLFKKLESAVLESAPLPCDFEVPPPPQGEVLDKNAVQVMFEPAGESKTEFPKANDAAQCGDKLGWFFDGDRMELCPNACTLVKKGGSISIGFGCEPRILF